MKNKIILSLVVIALFASAIGGWFYSQKEARKEVRRALLKADLLGTITYKDINYNPLTAHLSLSNVVIRPGRLPEIVDQFGNQDFAQLSIKEFDILNWEKENGIVSDINIELSGIKVNLLEITRLIGFVEPIQALIAQGYHEIDGYISLQYQYDMDDLNAEIEMKVAADKLGEIRHQFVLGQVTPKLLTLIKDYRELMIPGNNQYKLREYKQTFEKEISNLSLIDFELNYLDSGLGQTIKHFYQVDNYILPSKSSESILPENGKNKLINELGRLFSNEEAKETAGEIEEFLNSPESIDITTDIDEPIVFSELNNSRQHSPEEQLFLLANVKISTN